MKRLRFGIVLVSLTALFIGSAAMAAPKKPAADPSLSAAANKAFLKKFDAQPGVVIKPSGLRYKIIHNGYGKRPGPGDYVTVYYTGKLINGEVFDGTEPGMPARFRVNTLITGWSEALTLMRVGDHWQLVIPANMGYGERGAGEMIPPNQTLIFDLKLEKVVPPKPVPVDPNNPGKVDDNQDLGPDDSAG